MKTTAATVLTILVVGVLLLGSLGSVYTVSETEQVIITQFGQQIGDPVKDPGLHYKAPFIQNVNKIEKRVLEWDGHPIEMPTKDKTFISVDTFARWRITDARQYFLRLHDDRSAQSRLEDILGSETRNAVARHELIEIVRTDKDRQPVVDEGLKAAGADSGGAKIGVLPAIRYGRTIIEKEIMVGTDGKSGATPKLMEFGIELLDVRFRRINYNNEVLTTVHKRMTSERLQIAQRFRSEGEGQALRIIGNKERDLNEIESTAYKQVQQLHGEADGKASEIYAAAYNQNPQAAEFYQFLKSLETFKKVVDPNTTILLSTDSDLFRMLKHIQARPAEAPPPEAPH